MGAKEELAELEELERLEAKEQKILGVNIGGVKIGVSGPIAEDTGGFLKNAALTAASRVQQLGQKLPGRKVSPEQVERIEEELKIRTQQPGGSTGVFLGDTAAAGPFAAVGKGVQAARALPVMAGKLGRALTGKTAAAAAEGGAVGGTLNDDAASGAGVSVLLNTLARGSGKLLSGPVTKSDEAKALQQVAEAEGVPLDLPVGVAAKNPAVKKAFADVLPLLPGAQKAMQQQKSQVQGQLDDLALTRGVAPQDTASLLGKDIATPSNIENRMAWALASATGTAPKVVPVARAASSPAVNKALLGDYKVQKKIKEVGKKIEPLTAALRRIVTLEATEDE
jgi:hypothetical protein